MVDVSHESDIERVREIALAQQKQIRVLLQKLAEQSHKIDQLTGSPEPQELALRLAELNEAIAVAQEAAAKATRRKRSRRGHGPSKQTKLNVEVERFVLDEADRTCPACGERLEEMGDQVETSEMVDVIEVRYRLVKVQRQKYRCRCGGCVETAPGPDRVIDGGRYSLDFGVKAAVDKYAYHLPLARQSRMMRERGLKVSSQTLWDQIEALAELATPTYEALKAHILSQPVIGVDQTGWPRLDAKSKKKWQMWCLTAPDAVVHAIRDDKSAATFDELLGDYRGVIVCDALGTHSAGARGSPHIELAGCWAHIHRKFAESEPDHPQAAGMLELIGELYEIDGRATSDADRARLRDTESRAVLERMYRWLTSPPVLTTTSLGKAIKHTLSIWPRLKRFADDPRIWLDNNPTERGIRGPVVGRRNHFGSKSRRGTEVAAIFYTLVETAKLVGVEPSEYIAAVVRNAKLASGAVTLPDAA